MSLSEEHTVEIHLQRCVIYKCNLGFETKWEKKIETDTLVRLI